MTRTSLGIAVAGAALTLHERRERRKAERLAAATLETLLNAIDANDAITGAHVRRVASYALILARAANLDEAERLSVEQVALFHDIGKIHEAITDIFHEATKLTAEEQRAVHSHPGRGADVLRPLAAFYPDLCDGVLSHHERWDGKGYPRGLRGERIPLAARAVSIADTFDAITHTRRYNNARSLEVALSAVRKGRGTQFDPALVDVFTTPAVVRLVEQEMRAFDRPEKRGRRRSGRGAGEAPNIKFRWRSERGAQPRKDSTRQK